MGIFNHGGIVVKIITITETFQEETLYNDQVNTMFYILLYDLIFLTIEI